MALQQMNVAFKTFHYQKTTTNKSFLDMHYYLKDIGVANNAFMLILYDSELAGIDPHDKRLNAYMKQKVLREVMCNYWYFLREVVRIPDQGSTGGGTKYQLHRGNLALNFCMILNLNIDLELPRQQFKTVSALCRYLYLFNFGTSNSEIAFLNKVMDDSKLNLQRLKDLRASLPSYLQMSELYTRDGGKVKVPNTVETLQHVSNGNKIRTVASARNKVAAANLLRGRTLPLIWFDEYAFIAHNNVIFTNTMPAFKTASLNAIKNRAPYGILITTTPGFLTEDSGIEAFNLKENATKFSEMWYDMSYTDLMELIAANTRSNFVYIRYTYQQLGRTEEWFRSSCIDMRNQWADIRREILLEWSNSTDNCPFKQEDLEIVSQLIKQPIRQMILCKKYTFNVYEDINLRFPPIIGVDVSGGYNRDSSAVSCIDSVTTKLFADFNCNYISTVDLALVIHELVSQYMPNAVVNIERNGGFGASVLSKLITTDIKKNLYYEIKDKVLEERSNGPRMTRKTQKTKVYGLDSTKDIRERLIEILRERMEYHKDKFVSPDIYKELIGMEVKRSGKIEHSANTHDDQIFSLLMALYVWYEGKNIMENFGIQKSSLKTDDNLEEAVVCFEEKYGNILEEIENDTEEVQEQLAALKENHGKLFNEWMEEEKQKDADAMGQILSTRLGRKAYSDTYNIPLEELENGGLTKIPDAVFSGFYDDEEM
jgi:hypothetical protein